MKILPRETVLQLSDYPHSPIDRKDFLRLDSGELNGGLEELGSLSLPPDSIWAYPQYFSVLAKLSSLWNVRAEQILLTNGSDNGLLLIPQVFIEPGRDAALVSDPSFVVIPRSVQFAGANVISVPVDAELRFDLDGLERELQKKPKLAMFATPDNPTGQMISRDKIKSWLSSFPSTLFVIDEAYYEFSGITVMDEINSHDNLVVTRTFSKAWGIAGLRLGVIVSNPDVIRYLARVRLPYDVNGAAVAALDQLLDLRSQVNSRVRKTLATKQHVTDSLDKAGWNVVPGCANFFLVRAGERAVEVTKHLFDRKILVRNCTAPNMVPTHPLFGALRVSVAREDEMNRFLQAMLEIENG